MESFELQGQIVNLRDHTIFPGKLVVQAHRIVEVVKTPHAPDHFIIPGFVDAHVHIESSMLIPSEFARLAVVHGTVATVSDPHEIANVLGLEGVRYMISNSRMVNFKCFFGAPSCVPATTFETAGAVINPRDIESLLKDPEIFYLAEMMNWPGVLQNDPDVLMKIKLAHQYNKPVDGHAPGLRGEQARKYAAAGISTDHECFTLEEALEKLEYGMHIIIREGSAAKNFQALIGLLPKYVEKIMFCSDDKHPDNLMQGHINQLVVRGRQAGIDPLVLLQAACRNPVDHYRLKVGLLQQGDPADFLVVRDLDSFQVNQTYIDGKLTAENGKTLIPSVKASPSNNFAAGKKQPADFQVAASGKKIKVIVAEDGQLITKKELWTPKIENGLAVSDMQRDLLKIVVINRYRDAPPAVGFVRNFGLKEGAIASSVAHDSHNIIAVGTDDPTLCGAVNEIISVGGGVVALSKNRKELLPLPVAGLMSLRDGYQVAEAYTAVDAMAKSMGSTLQAPFMTLSFMALLVIPEIKLSDKGLFDGKDFRLTKLFED